MKKGAKVLSRYLDRYGSDKGWRYFDDLTFRIPFSFTAGTVAVPTTTNITITGNYLVPPQNSIDTVPVIRNESVFLFFRYLSVLVNGTPFPASPTTIDMQAIWDTQQLTFTFPANQSNVATNQIFPNMNMIRRIAFTTVPAGVTVSDVEVASTYGLNNLNTLTRLNAGLSITAPASFDFGPFGSNTYGLMFGDPGVGQSNGSLALFGNNTNAGTANVVATIYGFEAGTSLFNAELQYIDPSNFPHHLGMVQGEHGVQLFPVNQLINGSQLNPSGTYGQLRFTSSFTDLPPLTSGLSGYHVMAGTIILSAAVVTREDARREE